MSWVVQFGWLCAVVGTGLALPQLVKLVRGRTSAGLSLLMWQLMLSSNSGWAVHGVLTHHPNVWLPNIIITASVLVVLRLIRVDRRLSAWAAYPLGLAGAVVIVLVDVFLGPLIYGVIVLLPQAIGSIGQLRDLIQSPDLRGLSRAYIVGNVLVQSLWFGWSLAAHESAVMIAAGTLLVLGLMNVVWLLARSTGVAHPVVGRRAEVTEQAEVPFEAVM